MLSNLVVIREVTRGVTTLLIVVTTTINLSRGQLLKSNRSSNRLSHIIIHRDRDLNRTISALRSESLRAFTQNTTLRVRSLITDTLHQLRRQGVLLARNQTLVINSVDHRATSNNLSRTITELRIRSNARLKHGTNRLVLVVDVFVLSNVVGLAVSLLTGGVNLRRSQTLKRNRSLNRVLSVGHSDLNLHAAAHQVTCITRRLESHCTSTEDVVRILLINKLRIQRVVLASNKIGVVHGVHNSGAILHNLRTILELRRSADLRLRTRTLRRRHRGSRLRGNTRNRNSRLSRLLRRRLLRRRLLRRLGRLLRRLSRHRLLRRRLLRRRLLRRRLLRRRLFRRRLFRRRLLRRGLLRRRLSRRMRIIGFRSVVNNDLRLSIFEVEDFPCEACGCILLHSHIGWTG